MTIQDWGAIGEMIGGFAVIFSLIYVGSQIRQNTKATKSQASQAFVQAFKISVEPLVNVKEFRDLYWRGLSGLENLIDGEVVAFTAWIMVTLRSFESFYYQHSEGVFDDHIMEGWIHQYTDILGYKGSQEVWAIRRHQFGKDFQDIVEDILKREQAKPLYINR